MPASCIPVPSPCEWCKNAFPNSPVRPRRFCSVSCYQQFRGRRATREGFWREVEKSDGCWLWTGRTDKRGYGRTPKSRGRSILAHRIAWELTNGVIPDGLHVLHRCDNPSCVRPDHLFLGTHQDNMRDCARKKRCSFQTQPELYGLREGNRGAGNPGARLSADQVLEIRALYGTGTNSESELAARFSVNQSQISRIINRKTWRHLP